MKLPFCLSATLCLALAGDLAAAQRVDENAVRQAGGAFGKDVGGDSLGLYNPFDVRGFSSTDAGNVGLVGLYSDQQAEFISRLVACNRIHVRPSASGYAFPAPTGIVDYRLRRPGAERVISLVAKTDSFSASLIELDAQLPLRED